MSFSEDFTFTRGTGATRINAAGLIVGVDFSSTSITFGTGPKMFTLAADLMVNRDWSIGESVIAVSQASPLGNMEGTVTAYDPATQVLTIDVVTSTGTGTSTNWRIGSLEVRRDADGVLREPMRSNLVGGSDKVNFAASGTAVVTTDFALSPNGSINASRITSTAGNAAIVQTAATLIAGTRYTITCYVKANVLGAGNVFRFLGDGNLASGNFTATENFQRFEYAFTAVTGGSRQNGITRPVGDGALDIVVFGFQLETGSAPTSYIPTTTVAVTRNADTFAFTPAAIAKFRQGQGALVIEANASDAGTAQRAALRLTGPSGEIRFGKQGVATSSNFTKMAEGGDVQLLGNATQGVTNNGLEYGLFNPISTTTGLATGAFGTLAATYDGTSNFGLLSSGNAEVIANSTLTTIDVKGWGGTILNGAHHNGSRFIIAVGGAGVVGISTDGLSYRRVNTTVITQACNEVTSGMVGPTLRNVIVGNAGFIATSDDNGETWTSRTSGTASNITGATRSTTNFVVSINSNPAATNLRTSSDGITWNSVANSGVAQALLDVHANGAQVVAVGAVGVITVSNDNGATWTASASSGVTTTQQLNGVHYNASANLWVAVGNAGTIITATDPTSTWTLQTSGTAQQLNEVNYFNGLWLVAGGNGNILTSPNAVTWTVRPNFSALSGIAVSATRAIFTGPSGGFYSSEDGLTYTSRTNNNATLNGIAYGAGVYVSVGNAVNGSGYIATIDGAGTVTRRVSGVSSNLQNVKYLNGNFIAHRLAAANSFLVSSDGITWQPRGIASGQQMNSTSFGSSVYVAVGNNGNYSLSSDAITWSNTTISSGVTTQPLVDIDFANGSFVAVGNAGTIITGVYNGSTVTWTLRTSGTTQNLTSVIYSQRDQRWYAAGNAGTLLYSEDNGVTWASVNNAGFGAVSNTTLQANKLLPQWKTGRNTMALSYKANEVIVGLNGVAVTDTANTIPSITAGVLGETFNGKIKSAKFQPNPLTAAEVVAITGVTR